MDIANQKLQITLRVVNLIHFQYLILILMAQFLSSLEYL